MKNPFHVMLVPTLGCPARCSYCWSSEENSPVMSLDTVRDVVEWLKSFHEERITFTFHGGEPLLAGAEFFRQALPLLAEGLSDSRPDFALQSNLWRMSPEIAKILGEYNVPVGSSIDGPEEINDLQRGDGYYERTMRGYEIARANGLSVRFICTFTRLSFQYKEQIFNYFLERGFDLKLHPALPSLRSGSPEKWALPPAQYGDLLVYLLDSALEHMGEITVMNINDLCRCVFTRRGSVCTFVDCMGSTYAIGPDGGIYPCYRFVGMPKFKMGDVQDHPSREELASSPAGQLLTGFKAFVDIECAGCSHIRYCRGGCPYNAIVPTGGEISGVDPHCTAYKRIFDEISGRFEREMFGEQGIEVSEAGPGKSGGKTRGIRQLMFSSISPHDFGVS